VPVSTALAARVRRSTPIILGALALAAGGCSGDGTATEAGAATSTAGQVRLAPVPRATADRFDGRRAMALLRSQVRLGPRPAGSPALRRLSLRLRDRLPNGRFEAVPGAPRGMRNVVGHLPGRAPARRVAPPHDTKDIPGFVGANDGAAGTAAVVELARVLRAGRRACAREIRFVLFDGEESPDDRRDFYTSGLRGSRAYAARHSRELGSVVVIDFIAGHGVRLPRELGSDPGLWGRLRASARRVGVGAVFPPDVAPEVLDDHTPFTRAGVPAIDLIDFSYPHFHRTSDDLRAVSQRSLDAVGEALADFLRRESERTCR
jgi:hypothetical protein